MCFFLYCYTLLFTLFILFTFFTQILHMIMFFISLLQDVFDLSHSSKVSVYMDVNNSMSYNFILFFWTKISVIAPQRFIHFPLR